MIRGLIILFLIKVFFAKTENDNAKLDLSKFIKLKLNILGYPNEFSSYNLTSLEIINTLSNIKFQTELLIGSNNQKILSEIYLNTSSLYLSSRSLSKNNSAYDETKSNSYEEIFTFNLTNEFCSKCIYATDIININNKIYLKSKFLLGKEINLNKNLNNISSLIGLKIEELNKEKYNTNFVSQLYNYNYISKNIFRFRFSNIKNNLYNAELIIGEYPHNYLPNVYNENNLKSLFIGVDNDKINRWNFQLNYIYYDNMGYNPGNNVYINLNTAFFRASFYLYDYLNNLFFKELVEKKLCDNFTLPENKYYWICDNTINISKIKNFTFVPKKYDKIFNFTLTIDDIFYKYKNKYICLMYFQKYNFTWELGNFIVMKYQVVFDMDKKIIGFYDKIYPELEIDDRDDNNDNNIIFTFFIIFGLILILLIMGGLTYYLFKYMNKGKRKIQELKDEDSESSSIKGHFKKIN